MARSAAGKIAIGMTARLLPLLVSLTQHLQFIVSPHRFSELVEGPLLLVKCMTRRKVRSQRILDLLGQ